MVNNKWGVIDKVDQDQIRLTLTLEQMHHLVHLTDKRKDGSLTLKGTEKLQTDPWAIVAVAMMLKIDPQSLHGERQE